MKLTSDQRTRLIAFLTAVAASQALGESEMAEFQFLTGQAQKSGEFAEILAEAGKAKAQGDDPKPQGVPPVDPKAQGVPPTTREKIGAAIAGTSADTLAQVRVLTAENGRLKAELSQANAGLKAAQERIGTLEDENKALASKDKATKDKEVESQVRDELASVGQPENKLASNSTQGGSHEDNLDAIRAQIAQSTDPKEKGRLALKAKQLRESAGLN